MNYSKIFQKAKSKLKEYGSACVFYREDEDSESEKGTKVADGFAIQNLYSEQNLSGENVRDSSISLFCAVDGTVSVGDCVEFGGQTRTVISANPFVPNGKDCIYWNVSAR